MASTKQTQRCIIQEHSADMTASKKRWTVQWTANSDEKPVRFVCATKAAANQLAAMLDNPDVLWTSTPKTT